MLFRSVVGIVVLMSGAVTSQIVVGILGFVIMLVSMTVALTSLRGQQAAAAGDQGRTAHGLTVFDGGRSSSRKGRRGGSSSKRRGSFMERMDERSPTRRDQGGRFLDHRHTPPQRL